MGKKAKESQKIKKAREKLRAQLQKEHKKFSHDALHAVSKRIKKDIYRHHPEINPLQEKKIVLFDENHHTAQIKSNHILKLKKILEESQIL